MGYDYAAQKQFVLTDHGQQMLFKMMRAAASHIEAAGCVRMDRLISAAGGGDVWNMLACADYLVEMGEMIEVAQVSRPAGQHRIFTSFKV